MKKILTLFFLSLFINIYGQTESEINFMKSTSKKILNSNRIFEDDSLDKSKKNILYFFSISSNSSLIVSFTTSTDIMFDCHSCEPIISSFLFYNNNGWKLKRKDLSFGKMGSWGKTISKENIKVYPVKNNFLITIKTGYSQMGEYSEDINCFYSFNNEVKNIGTINVEYDNGDNTSYKSQYFLAGQENNVPVIFVYRTGVAKGKNFSETETYIFNEKKYEVKK